MDEAVLTSRLRCPRCGTQKDEQMPINSCMFFYICSGCDERLQPLAGDCCVFCSYGTVPCPPIQLGNCCDG